MKEEKSDGTNGWATAALILYIGLMGMMYLLVGISIVEAVVFGTMAILLALVGK